jgi:hypothetical protein
MNRLVFCIVSLALVTSPAFADCGGGGDCAVGGFGNGGVKSEGKAKGFHFQGDFEPTQTEGIVSSGTVDSGFFSSTSPLDGSVRGHSHSDGTFSGKRDGDFSDCAICGD